MKSSELAAVWRLGWPLAVANFGQVLVGAVDLAVVGRLGATELGAAGLGHTVYFCASILGMGVMLGFDPLLSQAYGADEHGVVRQLLKRALWLAAGISVPLMGAVVVAGWALERLGVDPVTAAATRDYLGPRLLGVVPFLLFVGLRSALQACGQARPMLVGVVAANLVNLPLSIVLVFGGQVIAPALAVVPPMGVAGAAWASTASLGVQLAVLVLAWRRFELPIEATERRRGLTVRAVRIGVPVALTLLGEFGAFVVVNVLIGRIGPVPLAAHQVAMTLASATYVVPLGIGAAASVRVGHAIGRQEPAGARAAARASLLLGVGFMAITALTFYLAPGTLSLLITDDAAVIATASTLVAIAAVFQLSDGVQAVLSGALRGAGDTRWPLAANLVGHYALGLPLGAVLAFELGLGSAGLWWGLSAGLTAVAAVLAGRWRVLSTGAMSRT